MVLNSLNKMGDIEDEVPPLEDMTETIKQLSITKHGKEKQKAQYLEATSNENVVKKNSILKLLDKEKDQKSAKPKKETTKPKQQNAENFCGFKKGFLTGKSTNSKYLSQVQTKATGKDEPRIEMDFDITRNKEASKDSNVIPEVQDSMKQQIPLLQSNAWVTDDLLVKIMKHPKLSKQFMDPRFSEAIGKFQKNPQEVMEMCSTNHELREFIQEFCAIMGDHFTGLADQQEKKKDTYIKPSKENTTKPSNNNNNMVNDDEAKMQQILSNPEYLNILKTPKVQQLLQLLRNDPDKAQRMIQTGDAELRHHIQKLIDAGIFQMAR